MYGLYIPLFTCLKCILVCPFVFEFYVSICLNSVQDSMYKKYIQKDFNRPVRSITYRYHVHDFCFMTFKRVSE